MKPRFLTLVGMIVMAAVARIMPHPWNVTPVAAMALFGGAKFDSKTTAFLVPILAMLAGDAVVGFHVVMPLVYLSFAISVAIGFWIRQHPGTRRLVAATFVSSVIFFIVTNFGTWAFEHTYPHTGTGLVNCYIAGLPYFRNTLFGDLAYVALLFGAFDLATRAFPALRDAS